MTASETGLEFVKQLDYAEAMTILFELCKDKTQREKIVARAKEILTKVDAIEIEEMVFATLNSIMMEEYWDAASHSVYGFREETEIAFEMVEDAVSELERKMKEFRKLGMKEMEKRYCMGIVGGLLRYGSEGTNEFHNAVPDDPYIIVDNIFSEWKKCNPPEEWPDVAATIRRYVEEDIAPGFYGIDSASGKMIVALESIADKFEEAADGVDQYLNTATGEFEYLFDGTYIEEDEELAEKIDDSDDYVRLPGQFELNEYKIMKGFAEACQDAEKQTKLIRALGGKKPFRNFKDNLYDTGLEKEYYSFRFLEFISIAREWCEDNEIPYKAR